MASYSPRRPARKNPTNGQFTQAGAGRHDGSWTGGGFSGGGGGGFGGGGASGSWRGSDRRPQGKPRVLKVGRRPPDASGRSGSTIPGPAGGDHAAIIRPARAPAAIGRTTDVKPYRRIVRNGYEFHVDERQRTRLVSGALHRSETRLRSQHQQRQAGRPDRRSSDDGGHYIAPRFGGPTEAFNHFAHDANLNRGRYRVMENQWDQALKQGRRVSVRIAPRYSGQSIRPESLNVHFIIDGQVYTENLKNERREKRHVK